MRIGRTRLPIPANDYQQEWGSALIRAIDQNFDAAFANIENAAAVTGYYGSFYDTTTQTAALANTPYAMQLNTTVESNQIAVVSGSRITFKNRGTYNIQFSAQLDKIGGSASAVYIWPRINGANVPDSATKIVIDGPNAEVVPAWNFVLVLQAGDYFELAWQSSDTDVVISAAAAASNYPGIPSIIFTVTWVSNYEANE